MCQMEVVFERGRVSLLSSWTTLVSIYVISYFVRPTKEPIVLSAAEKYAMYCGMSVVVGYATGLVWRLVVLVVHGKHSDAVRPLVSDHGLSEFLVMQVAWPFVGHQFPWWAVAGCVFLLFSCRWTLDVVCPALCQSKSGRPTKSATLAAVACAAAAFVSYWLLQTVYESIDYEAERYKPHEMLLMAFQVASFIPCLRACCGLLTFAVDTLVRCMSKTDAERDGMEFRCNDTVDQVRNLRS